MRKIMDFSYIWFLLISVKFSESAVFTDLTQQQQIDGIMRHQAECIRLIESEESTLTGAHCPLVWDNIMCWPDTVAGGYVDQFCPDYIRGFDTQEKASRTCSLDGTWYVPPMYREFGLTDGWSNYTSCIAPISY